ncbi:MAG TPA: hypothetical protein VF816_11625 [Rhodocyclaceae bacterium]
MDNGLYRCAGNGTIEPMHETNGNRPGSRYERTMKALATLMLVTGLGVAAAIFVLAPAESTDVGGPYATTADNSKKYQLELRRIGGTAAVAAAEFNEWFDTLWHGRRLAGTVAVLSIALWLLARLAARLPPLDD